MRQWKPFPLPDGSYSDETRPWTDQDVVNYLPTAAEATGSRSGTKYTCAPGMEAFAGVGDGPHRGGCDVEGKCFIVSGSKLYQVSTLGVSTEIGTIPGTGRVSMTHNQISGGNQLLIGTGDNSYIYNTATSTLTATTIPLFSVDFINQRFVGVDPQRRFWRYSGLADGLSWNDLDNEDAESAPDRIVGGIVAQSEWLVFGERTIEVWPNNPNDTSAFPARSAVIEHGCANYHTIRRIDNSVIWLGNDSILYQMRGYTVQAISTKAHTDAFRACDPDKAFAFTYEDNGYVIYYLTFKDGQTWGFDVTRNKMHRRESFGLDRWRLNTLFKWNGDWYGGDYSSNVLYRLRWKHPFEGCDTIARRLRTGYLHNFGNRLRVHGMRLFGSTGTPLVTVTEPAITITGFLPDGTVGDVVSFQYTAHGAYPGQTVTFTLASGALPDGLSMSASGLVTGTLTTAGTFNWSIMPSGDCATGTEYFDNADIITGSYDPNITPSKYLLIDFADSTDYSAPGYDDSAWTAGLLPLSSTATRVNAPDFGFPLNQATAWPLTNNAWFRGSFPIIVPADMTLDVFLDDAAEIFINGVSVFSHTTDDGGGTTYFWTATVPASAFVAGLNYVAIKGRADIHGIANYISYRLTVI